MILRDASDAEIDRILAGTHVLWSDGLDPAAYQDYVRTLMKSAWGREEGGYRFMVLAEGGGEPEAALKLYRFTARWEARPVTVGGLGAVFTPPENRRRGLAAEAVRLAHEEMMERGDAISLLYSEIGGGYYQRLGYTTLDPGAVVIAVPPEGPAPASGLRRMHRSEREIAWRLRERADAAAGFAITRSFAYFCYLLARASYPTLHLGQDRWESRLILDGRSGYLWTLLREPSAATAHDGGAAARVLEFAEQSPGASLPGLMDELFFECRRRGIATVEAWQGGELARRDPRLAATSGPPSVIPMWRPLTEEPAGVASAALEGARLHPADVF